MRLSRTTFGILCTIPGLATLLAFIFYPTVYNVWVSLLKYDNRSPIVFSGIRNYLWLFRSPDFARSWTVSTVSSLGTTGWSFLIGLLLAHCLRAIGKGRNVYLTLVMLPWIVPPVIAGLMWKWMFNQDIGVFNYLLKMIGLIDRNIPFLALPGWAMTSAILTGSFFYAPFITVILLAGLESIPEEVYEAAQADGANNLQCFYHMSLPLNRHQMIVAFVIVLMFSFRTPDIFFSLTRGGPAKHTYHAGLFLQETIYRYLNFGHAGAIGVVLFASTMAFAFPILYHGIMKRST